MTTVAIIGGGPTGLAIARELKAANVPFVLYEAEADFGGVWNSEGDSGRTYPSLRLISTKLNTQFPDFPMPAEYPHYPNHRQMLTYLRAYADHFGLYDRARFGARIEKLEPHEQGWRLQTAAGYQATHDLVVVCNGLQRLPSLPSLPDADFSGEILHASAYKSPDQLRGKRVLVVGGGNSGCDIASEAVHHAQRVCHSTRRGYHYQPKFIHGMPTPQWIRALGGTFPCKEALWRYAFEVFKTAGFDGVDYGLPAPDHPVGAAHPILNSMILYHIGHGDIVAKGNLMALAGNRAIFADHTEEDVDLVIYATGYERDLSFLDPGLLPWRDGIPDLFLHFAPRHWHNLLFMGFVNAAGGLGDAVKIQSRLVLDYIRAYFTGSRGLQEFLHAKQHDRADIGQADFITSRRHLWEADLWRYLVQLRKYSNMLRKH